jgi:putative MATE family efflux protein
MRKENKIINDLTEGPVFRQLAVFALPFVLSSLLQTVYSIVDMVVVGQVVGSTGLSAVGISSQVLNICTAIGMGFGAAGQITLSQQVGAKDYDGIQHTVGTLLTAEAVLAVFFGILGAALRGPFLNLMNTPAEAFADGAAYLAICCAGMLFIYGYNAICAILRGMGESRLPLVFIAIASVVNLVLDVVLIAGFQLGVAGAALATVIGQGVAFVLALVYLYRRREAFGFDFRPASFRPRAFSLKTLIKLGVPLTAQMVVIMVSMMFINSQINVYGVIASAVDNVGNKLYNIMNVVAGGMYTACAAMIGQSFGARKFDRVRQVVRACLVVCMAFWAVVSVAILLWPTQIFGLFSQDADILAMAPQYMQILVITFLSFATMNPYLAVVDGVGAARFGLVVTILDGVIARIGLSLLLSRFMGLPGYWLGSALAGFVSTVLAGGYYYLGIWKKRELLVENPHQK